MEIAENKFFLESIMTLIFIFDFTAIAVVTWGGLAAIYEFLKCEIFSGGRLKEELIENLRVRFGQKILVSLEFFVVSDLIKLIVSPTFEALGKLASFVVIRTVLSYFLNKEIHEIKEEHRHNLKLKAEKEAAKAKEQTVSEIA
jgi:uncharacterized membrane protein